MRKFIFIIQLIFFSVIGFAQETIVRGRITDVNTNEAIPFANVKFKGITTGASADFDGYYIIRTNSKVDSITANYLGYKSRTKRVKSNQSQTIDFQLKSTSVGIKEVVVEAGVNPAIQVIKDAQKRRDLNNKSSLPAYQYENYSKIQIDVDNISDKVRSKKI
ncbi:MAG: carboxypeptidase-like regulatory domain-containing protein [bacterium]